MLEDGPGCPKTGKAGLRPGQLPQDKTGTAAQDRDNRVPEHCPKTGKQGPGLITLPVRGGGGGGGGQPEALRQ
jgi:hypothetical protein